MRGRARLVILVCGLTLRLAAPPAAVAAFGPITQISLAPGGAQPDADSYAPALSADGAVVAFVSAAGNLAADDNNGVADVFVVDRSAGTTTRIVDAGGEFPFDSEAPALSGDGKLVAFVTDGELKVFNRDLGSVQDIVALINQPYAFSGNGRFLVIAAEDEQQLAPDDQNGVTDVFLFDRLASQFERISSPPEGGEADGPSVAPAITPEGRYVAFVSGATNLVPGGDAGERVFIADRIAGTVERVSGLAVAEAGLLDTAMAPALSNDGRFVAYVALDRDSNTGLYLRDRQVGTTTVLAVSGPSGTPDFSSNSALTISGAGQRLVFGLFGELFEDVYLFDLAAMATIAVSAAADGGPADGDSIGARLSNDGRAVAFVSDAANMVASGPDGITQNVFLATPSPPACQPGDVNGDGAIDAADIPALIQLIFGNP